MKGNHSNKNLCVETSKLCITSNRRRRKKKFVIFASVCQKTERLHETFQSERTCVHPGGRRRDAGRAGTAQFPGHEYSAARSRSGSAESSRAIRKKVQLAF